MIKISPNLVNFLVLNIRNKNKNFTSFRESYRQYCFNIDNSHHIDNTYENIEAI